ncbi:AMP-binding protein [Candidatus Pseudothioglobus singularis]|nr:AMP-binding protein [Candidatus Pseudothioglobus singularis]MDB4822100.1 AMP-binding protein [Candidatus Pseudothioglobus singularis]
MIGKSLNIDPTTDQNLTLGFFQTLLNKPMSSILIEDEFGEEFSLYLILSTLESVNKEIESLDNRKEYVVDGKANIQGFLSILTAILFGLKIRIIPSVHNYEKSELNSIITNKINELKFDKKFINPTKFNSERYLGIKKILNKKIYDIKSDFQITLETSGTTSTPVQIKLNLSALIFQGNEVSKSLQLTSKDRQLFYMPLNYVYGVSIIMTSLIPGACLVVSSSNLENPNTFLEQIKQRGITIFSGVPYVYQLLKKWGISNLKNSKLRTLTQAGGKLGVDIKNEIINKLPRCKFFIMYGQTEFGGRITQFELKSNLDHIESVGRPLSKILIVIVSEDQKLLADGKLGEVFVHTPSLSSNLKNLTNLIRHQSKDYFATGDLGYLKDGFLYIEGRNKNFVKIAGKRLNLTLIESHLKLSIMIDECVIEFDEIKFPKILIGIFSKSFKGVNSQAEMKIIISEILSSNPVILKIINGIPFFCYIINGKVPLLMNNKINSKEIKLKLINNYYDKKHLHIWL